MEDFYYVREKTSVRYIAYGTVAFNFRRKPLLICVLAHGQAMLRVVEFARRDF